ncbi:MAG: bifunctional UDP-N-acetylmuramoyl-tripeptide:D-alanyl-D-alanine ligase/alanine racemase [Bacteroidetes bacterium]|nr:bifunctional UDP-N-acetylmuramoyl-tripeptide:D-alanyl-D-alanine ligase/alanine racemase [Bacteroidota bacterium]MBU1578158.1 bifunctional UDP-N-acetylmuramoyl-tripeptide:D-alanyl-D-alanine ligase/alanine racemase [Bacteroidota bacterium]MBU2557568.1 bifunctional UDP-N-acetylmuramoyl-tripeptide:D-alanyl-D-alanine ligase/alanine racemase [Bacteroidota bacterium]
MNHQKYLLQELAEIVDGQLLSGAAEHFTVRDIIIDSRQFITAANCMFVALVSDRNDGHRYIKQLYDSGLRVFLISRTDIAIESMPDAAFLLVADTLTALQQLAAFHRKQFDIPVIGITGSNGKTIIKEWLFQLLSPDRTIIRSPKSYNSQIGVPLSVWQMDKQHDLAIFEAGISEPDEMDKLQAIIKPSIGLFTNIGQAHSENFIQTNQKVGEKLKLFTKVDTLVYCADHADIQSIIIRSELLRTIQAFSWSRKYPADLRILEVTKTAHLSNIVGVYKEKEIRVAIPFTDEASIENAIHCWAMMLLLGIPQTSISERMERLVPIAMRLELKSGINNCTIINDSYNSDVNSLVIALDFMNQQQQHPRKTLILSDILQSGRNEVDLYAFIAQLVEAKGINNLIGIGPAISRQAERFTIPKVFYPSTADFLSHFSLASLSNQTILLKGARVFEFEQISNQLQEKAHETVLEINLNQLVSNLNYFRSRVSKSTKIMAMVKAFSYGSGSFEVANVLQFHQVDYLAVAYTDEGVELRKAGVNLPIMVMSPEESSFDGMLKHQLEPEVFSFRILDLLEETIRRTALPPNKPVRIHLKLDTGMHRLGFCPDQTEELLKRVRKNPMLMVKSIFSHLAASDKPDHDDFTREQIALFDSLSARLANGFSYPVMRHILNTGGIMRFPEAQFDMVRLGIGLYGVPQTAEEAEKLQAVVSLKSILSQIKTIKPGESVGYNRSGLVRETVTIGVVPVGYADGLPRRLGNGVGCVWVRRQKAPLIGDVCMDMCMVDLSGIAASEGDTVIVFDDAGKLLTLAAAAETIPYEILTRISRRVKRVYFQE